MHLVLESIRILADALETRKGYCHKANFILDKLLATSLLGFYHKGISTHITYYTFAQFWAPPLKR